MRLIRLKKVAKNFERGGTHIKKSIRRAYEHLSHDPTFNTMFLEGALRGKRKYKFMGAKLRIEFAICEECRRLGHTTLNNYIDCKDIPDNAVKIFDVFFKETFMTHRDTHEHENECI